MAYLYATNAIIIRKVQNTDARVRKRIFAPEIFGKSGFMIFSAKSADGARSVPDAVDMIAERSAPKNITWRRSGVFSSMSVGRIR